MLFCGWSILRVGLMLLLMLLCVQRWDDPDSGAVSVCSSCTQPVRKTASKDLRRVKPPWAHNLHITPHRRVDLHPNTWGRDWPSVPQVSCLQTQQTFRLNRPFRSRPLADSNLQYLNPTSRHQSVIKYTFLFIPYHNSNRHKAIRYIITQVLPS